MLTKSILSLCTLSCAVACGDAQTDVDYKGQALFSISGSVRDVSVDTTSAEPVIAFVLDRDDRDVFGVYLMASEVQGEFPSKFTMSVYQPPPAEMMFEVPSAVSDDPERPLEIAVGSVAAAFPGYPKGVMFTEYGEPEVDGNTYETKITDCVPGGECYVKRSTCRFDMPGVCTTERDPAAPARTGLDWMAGRSDVSIVYLSRDLDLSTEAGRELALELGASTKGYHAFQTFELGEKELAQAEACLETADQNVRDAYKQETGLEFSEADASEADNDAFYNEVEAEEARLMCPDTFETKEVDPDASIVVNMYTVVGA